MVKQNDWDKSRAEIWLHGNPILLIIKLLRLQPIEMAEAPFNRLYHMHGKIQAQHQALSSQTFNARNCIDDNLQLTSYELLIFHQLQFV